MAFLICGSIVYLMASVGLMEHLLTDGDMYEHLWLVFVIAFGWPVWLPLLLAGAIIVYASNGCWRFL